MDKPPEITDINNYRVERLRAVKAAVQDQIRQFLLANHIDTLVTEWDETSDVRKLRCTLRNVVSNDIVLIGDQFHRDLLRALRSSSAPELNDYEVNPFGESGYITFDKQQHLWHAH